MADVDPEDVQEDMAEAPETVEEGTFVPEDQPEADPEAVEELKSLGSDDQPGQEGDPPEDVKTPEVAANVPVDPSPPGPGPHIGIPADMPEADENDPDAEPVPEGALAADENDPDAEPVPEGALAADENDPDQSPEDEAGPVSPPEPPRSWEETLGDALGASAAAALIDAGYLAKEALDAASNEALLEVKGVGPSTLEKIRAFAAEQVEPVTPLQNVEEVPSDGEVQKSARVRRIHESL